LAACTCRGLTQRRRVERGNTAGERVRRPAVGQRHDNSSAVCATHRTRGEHHRGDIQLVEQEPRVVPVHAGQRRRATRRAGVRGCRRRRVLRVQFGRDSTESRVTCDPHKRLRARGQRSTRSVAAGRAIGMLAGVPGTHPRSNSKPAVAGHDVGAVPPLMCRTCRWGCPTAGGTDSPEVREVDGVHQWARVGGPRSGP